MDLQNLTIPPVAGFWGCHDPELGPSSLKLLGEERGATGVSGEWWPVVHYLDDPWNGQRMVKTSGVCWNWAGSWKNPHQLSSYIYVIHYIYINLPSSRIFPKICSGPTSRDQQTFSVSIATAIHPASSGTLLLGHWLGLQARAGGWATWCLQRWLVPGSEMPCDFGKTTHI